MTTEAEGVKPTARPWRYQEGSDAYTHIISAGENTFLCALQQDRSGRAEADARLIVTCVNLHDELVEVLKTARQQLVTLGGDPTAEPDFKHFCDDIHASVFTHIDAVLAKVKP